MKVIAVVPTYNEVENVDRLAEALRRWAPEVEALIVDDRSPDGTGERVRALARTLPPGRLRLLDRPGPRGRGLAGIEGMLHALADRADRIVEMDADLSHHPRHIPALLAALDAADVAVGSRHVPGGRDRRGIGRRAVTRASTLYARLVLGLAVRDTNSGFRAFRRTALEAIDLATCRSAGPAIVQEMLVRARRAGLRIREVPIDFEDRRAGTSKLGVATLIRGALRVLELRHG